MSPRLRPIRRAAAALALAALPFAAPSAHAQSGALPITPAFTAPGVTYRAGIPTPREVLGFDVGTRHSRPDEIVAYARALAAVSDRLVVSEYARTVEGRPLVHVVATSPANHARLGEIEAANRRLSDDPGSVRDADIAAMPVVAFLGYSVHGNEASGADASLLVLYHLAAADGPSVDELLRRSVLVIDPLLNPDGRARFADWANRMRGAVPVADAQDLEHNEPWPGGRTNHYWFDLNRDWLPGVHPESAARIREFQRWRPQILTDHHEMGGESTFFFQPGVPSRTNPNTPAENQALTARIGAFHARALDRIGSLYYSREGFDDFYYGKGSTYPDPQGAVGILFEQASSRALVVDTRTNGRLTYGATVRNQVAASLSTMEAIVALHDDLLRFQRDSYRTAVSDARRLARADGYVFTDGGDPARAALLVSMLAQHRIRVHRLSRSVEAEGQRFAAGSAYVVPLDQPQARLVRGLFERPTTFTDSLFYDVSAWTLPDAFGLPMADLASAGGAVGEIVAPTVTRGADGREVIAGRSVGGRATLAYAIPWGTFFAPRALARLQAAGVRVRLLQGEATTTVAGQRMPLGRGTLVVPVAQEVPAETVHALVEQAVREDGVTAVALGSGQGSEAGEGGMPGAGLDLGSPSATILTARTIALVVGEGTDSGNAGEAWHLLSERMRMPVALLDARRMGTLDLGDYTTLLLTGGSYPAAMVDPVKAWVARGGTLVASSSAAAWAVENGLTPAMETRRAGRRDSLLMRTSYADLDATRGSETLGGAIFTATLDTTHPLAYGLPARLSFFRDSGTALFSPPSVPGATVARYTSAPLRAGYLPASRRAQVSGAAAAVAVRSGRGRVVVLPDTPTFRGFWLGTSALYLNAIMLSEAY